MSLLEFSWPFISKQERERPQETETEIVPRGIEKEAPVMWQSQVHKEEAQKAGLKPEDFQFDKYPVADVGLEPSTSRHYAAQYVCTMPKDTPLDNQYDEYNEKLPDPSGICLARVEFCLYDIDTHEAVHEFKALGSRDGKVIGFLNSGKDKVWQVLTPGTTLRVKVVAIPYFYYLMDGGAQMQYTTNSHGYFMGKAVESKPYTLSMDDDGNVAF